MKKFTITLLLMLFSLTIAAKDISRSWTAIGPVGGSTMDEVYFSPSDENILYGFPEADDSLHKSQDGGVSWLKVNTEKGTKLSSNILVDPNNPEILYGINNGLLSKSINGGQQWSDITQGLNIDANSFFLLSSTQSLKVLINGNDPAQDEQTLATSQDSGLTWTSTVIPKINNQQVNIEGINSDNTNILYGSLPVENTNRKILYKSNNEGKNWFEILPDSYQYVGGFKIHPLDHEILYARFISEHDEFGDIFFPSQNKTVYMRSIDGGITWINFLSQASLDSFSIKHVTFDPTDTKTLYAEISSSSGGIGFGYVLNVTVIKSIDSGKNWITLYEGNYDHQAVGIGGVTINPKNNQHLFYYAHARVNAFERIVTFDGGEHWVSIESALRRVKGILGVAKNDPDVMYLADNASENFYKSLDAGENWSKEPMRIDSDDHCVTLIINPKENKSILCVAKKRGGSASKTQSLYKSIDSGSNWNLIRRFEETESLNGDARYEGAYSYANDGKTIYFVNESTLSKSTDDGDNWRDIKTLPSNLVFYKVRESLKRKILVDPRNADIIYTTGFIEQTKGVYKSTDGGENWALILDATSSTENSPHFRILMHPNYPNRLLVINHVTRKLSGVSEDNAYITNDDGNNWEKLPKSFFKHLSFTDFNTLEFNPKTPNGLFFSATDGLYESQDLGLSWAIVNKYNDYHNNFNIFANDVYSRRTAPAFKLSAPAISTEGEDCLFNWAEQQYPSFFSPALTPTHIVEDYTYRHYSETNVYLGVFQDKKVHLLQANLTDEIEDLGLFENFQHLAGCD